MQLRRRKKDKNLNHQSSDLRLDDLEPGISEIQKARQDIMLACLESYNQPEPENNTKPVTADTVSSNEPQPPKSNPPVAAAQPEPAPKVAPPPKKSDASNITNDKIMTKPAPYALTEEETSFLITPANQPAITQDNHDNITDSQTFNQNDSPDDTDKPINTDKPANSRIGPVDKVLVSTIMNEIVTEDIAWHRRQLQKNSP